jgi:hypothetical protein
MATTTNYGWTTPDDTALVKDGAAAIRTLGSSVDTTTKALNPSTTLGDIEYRSSTANTNTRVGIGSSGQALTVVAGVPSWAASATSVLTTTGDTLYASGANTLARRAIGSTGDVLTVSGGLPTWAAPSSGGMTLISTTAMTGASITLSSIPSGYVDLKLVLVDPYMSDDQENIKIRLNSNSSTVYTSVGTNGGSTVAFDGTDYLIAYNLDNTLHSNLIDFYLFNYSNSTTWKIANTNSISRNGVTSTSANFTTGNLLFGSTTAITSILVFATGGSFSGGTAYLYGVK